MTENWKDLDVHTWVEICRLCDNHGLFVEMALIVIGELGKSSSIDQIMLTILKNILKGLTASLAKRDKDDLNWKNITNE